MPNLLNIADAIWWRVTPTVATLYYNRNPVLHEPEAPPALPNADWANRERREMLSGSEDRLRNLEGKGPGLATVSAVVVAAVLLVLTSGWKESNSLARVIIGLAAAYALFSLLMPLYLVGPLKRNTVGVPELKKAAAAADPEETLAVEAANAAMSNNLRNIRVANLLDASRRELSYAVGLLVVWLLLVPATGFLRVAEHRPPSHRRTTTALALSVVAFGCSDCADADGHHAGDRSALALFCHEPEGRDCDVHAHGVVRSS